MMMIEEALITYVTFPVWSKIPEPPDAKFTPRRIADWKPDIRLIKERKGGGLLLYPKCLTAIQHTYISITTCTNNHRHTQGGSRKKHVGHTLVK